MRYNTNMTEYRKNNIKLSMVGLTVLIAAIGTIITTGLSVCGDGVSYMLMIGDTSHGKIDDDTYKSIPEVNGLIAVIFLCVCIWMFIYFKNRK